MDAVLIDGEAVCGATDGRAKRPVWMQPDKIKIAAAEITEFSQINFIDFFLKL